LLAACLALRWSALDALDALEFGCENLVGNLFELLCRTRRHGLRGTVDNASVVQSSLNYASTYPVPTPADWERLTRHYPERSVAHMELDRSVTRRLEVVLAAARQPPDRRRVLLDGRGILARHNGSAQCGLGFLDGFAASEIARRVDILISAESARFHRLSERYKSFRILLQPPTEAYSAAVTLTQPWSLDTVAELHRLALIVVFNMIDTIAWDVLYPDGAAGLGVTWRFIARQADGLIFNSHFTRERFATRFPIDPTVLQAVTHHSFLPEEHVDRAVEGTPMSDYILVFGNELDHKHVRPTAELLAAGFPLTPIVAFGLADAPTPNVTAIPSGLLEHAGLHKLIAGARVIVYPSYYEGFGLPVVEGLSYGRPVIVRRSALWPEIAGYSRLPGELIEFETAPSLIECVGRVLGGLPNRALPRGNLLAPDAAPASWKDCADRVIQLLERCSIGADGKRWSEREEALQAGGR
jgi:glycosyltransferase involved in cell wall biosynthesis